MKNHEAQHLYNNLIDNGSYQLTKWEIDFLDSINQRLDNGQDLSIKQGEVLENIYNKAQRG